MRQLPLRTRLRIVEGSLWFLYGVFAAKVALQKAQHALEGLQGA